MSEEFLQWWREHYDMAHLALGAASDAWEEAQRRERERCIAEVADIIRIVVSAERERCAAYHDRQAADHAQVMEGDEWHERCNFIHERCAAWIRSGATK